MDKLEKELKKVLEKNGLFDASKSETLRKEIVQMFEDKLKKVRLWTWGFLLIDVIIIVSALITFFHSTSTKAMILCAMVVVVAHDSTVLIKLWYWVVHTRINLQKELKQLQLQIAELAGKEPPSEN